MATKLNSQLITQYISLIAIILFIILFCIIIIIFIASLIKPSCSNSNILGIQSLFITFFDTFIDFGYLTILCLHFNTIYDDYFLSFLIYLVSLLISIMINIVCSFGIFYKQFKLKRNKLTNEWLKKNKNLLYFILMISSFDLNCILIFNSKIQNKSWSLVPIHPFIIQRIQFWSVINKFIENIPQIYVIIHLFSQFKQWDNHYTSIIFGDDGTFGSISIISLCSLIISSIDIIIAFYTFFLYKRDSIKRIPRNEELNGSNVQINDYMNIDQTPIAGDV